MKKPGGWPGFFVGQVLINGIGLVAGAVGASSGVVGGVGDGDSTESAGLDGDPFFGWIVVLYIVEFFVWVFDSVAEGDFEHSRISTGDSHGVGEVGSAFGLVVDFPLHDVWSAGGAFFGFA